MLWVVVCVFFSTTDEQFSIGLRLGQQQPHLYHIVKLFQSFINEELNVYIDVIGLICMFILLL